MPAPAGWRDVRAVDVSPAAAQPFAPPQALACPSRPEPGIGPAGSLPTGHGAGRLRASAARDLQGDAPIGASRPIDRTLSERAPPDRRKATIDMHHVQEHLPRKPIRPPSPIETM